MRDLLIMQKSIFQKNPTLGNGGKSGVPPTTKSMSHKHSNFERRESYDTTKRRLGRRCFPKRGQKHDKPDKQARKEHMSEEKQRILKQRNKTNSNEKQI